MNRNRILGITVLLAVLALGLAFMSCPADTEDRVIEFSNWTSIEIKITTDGDPAILTLDPARSPTDRTQTGTVTKTGADITLKIITYGDDTVAVDPDNYIDFSASVTPGNKKVKNGVSLGSGTIIFKPATTDKYGESFSSGDNPAAVW